MKPRFDWPAGRFRDGLTRLISPAISSSRRRIDRGPVGRESRHRHCPVAGAACFHSRQNGVRFAGDHSGSAVPSRLSETPSRRQTSSNDKTFKPMQFPFSMSYVKSWWELFNPRNAQRSHSTHARNTHGTRTMSTRTLNDVGRTYCSVAASLSSCSRMARWVHHNAAALLMWQVRGQSETHFSQLWFSSYDTWLNNSSSVLCQVLQSAAVARRQEVVLAPIVPTDFVCTGLGHELKQDTLNPFCSSHVFRICIETSGPATRSSLGFLSCTFIVRQRIHIPGTYHTTAAATCTRGNTTEGYRFLRMLAAVVRLHRTGTRAWSRCVAVYLRIWSRRILHRYLFVFVQDFFSTSTWINPRTSWNKHSSSSSVTASGQYRRVAASLPP